MKVNLGCGKDVREGWVNVDHGPRLPDGVVNVDLDRIGPQPGKRTLPWRGGSVEEIHMSHVIEHLKDPLPLMEELYRVAAEGCQLVIRCPHGASNDADEDPTHVRRMFPGSFQYFSQPIYWRADYGYRGDWQLVVANLLVYDVHLTKYGEKGMLQAIEHGRNFVQEMVIEMVPFKPARRQDRALLQPTNICFIPLETEQAEPYVAPDLATHDLT